MITSASQPSLHTQYIHSFIRLQEGKMQEGGKEGKRIGREVKEGGQEENGGTEAGKEGGRKIGGENFKIPQNHEQSQS